MNYIRVNIILFSSTKNNNVKHLIQTKEGTNLLDAINEAGIPDISVFGVCDKQLACHSCAVHIIKKYDIISKPSELESDVLSELGDLYREHSTRMCCQIFINKDMEGLEVEIPRSAFFFSSQNNTDTDML